MWIKPLVMDEEGGIGAGAVPPGDGNPKSRWAKIDEIVEFALAAPPDRRNAFVKAVCGGDVELRNEVLSLLEHVGAGEELFSNLSAALSGRGTTDTGGAEDPLVGQTIRRYLIKERLPSGMACVYRAWDLAAEVPVVLKLTPVGLEVDAAIEAARRMRREAHADVTLIHPNVCRVLDDGETEDGRAFVVFEFCPGQTLRARFANGSLVLPDVLLIGTQVASALAAAHALGLIHRDVKPSNIMVNDALQVKLLDFGIARLEDNRLTRTGQILGTLEYMSPEQAFGAVVESGSDVWSLGVVLYEGVTGRHPFRRESKRATVEAIRDATIAHDGWSDGLPKEIGDLIRAMLNAEGAARPSAVDVSKTLHAYFSR